MPYARYTAWPPGLPDKLHLIRHDLSPSISLLSRLTEDSPPLFNLIGQCFQDASLTEWNKVVGKQCLNNNDLAKASFKKANLGLPEAVTRVSNAGDQLICWPCIAKKPAFMLINEFMQHWTQLFSYLDSGYFHRTMELPTAQEKSK
jgi:hypothetical protein